MSAGGMGVAEMPPANYGRFTSGVRTSQGQKAECGGRSGWTPKTSGEGLELECGGRAQRGSVVANRSRRGRIP
jgi:hypothetical protein